ncbi:hypothetical protein EC957_008791 [Mortierella hygrophila]|uniref:Glycosyltransferase 61 catalytic domain-containing protein n=1 Tax=Mortierella hygrophila TaxID=979708 RepID=A0A9P6EWW0_9FUNG|nr:hypothetical protein EC957_008791 [Mortierella hygrophila]
MSFVQAAKAAINNLTATRSIRRLFLVLLIFTIGGVLMFTLNRSSSMHLGFSSSSSVYFGLDSEHKPVTAQNNRWGGQTVAKDIELPEATWVCTDDDLSGQEKETTTNRRSRQCVVQHLCVDRQGAFIRSNGIWPRKNLPKINLMSADAEADFFWQPRLQRSWRNVIRAHYVNETVFVHGLYSPFHFSHWLYNGMIPLYSTMKRFGGTKDSWTFRAGRFFYDPIGRMGTWEMDHFFETGKELVLAQSELSTPFQTLPPEDTPICFRRAVIGLGSQCGLDYCENNTPAEVYKTFQEEIAEHYWSTPLTWEKHVKSAQESINRTQEKEQTHKYGQDKIEAQEQEVEKKKAAKLQLRCLDLARYYNFESAGPNHGIENGEAKSRVGQMHPDIIDPAETYQNLIVEGKEGEAAKESKRKLVVGIIQRERSRRIVNDEKLIQGLVQSGFRVKWITFDQGCGIAETAYLLRDINVLISPHGNALGTSIFMPRHEAVPTVISVDTTRYNEPWFKFTTTAIGQRFIRTVCGPTNYVDEVSREHCPYFKDLKGAWDIMSSHSLVLGLPDSMVKTDKQKESMSGDERDKLRDASREYVKNNPAAQKLAEQEMDVLIGPEMPVSIIQKYGEIAYGFLGVYWKGSPRYVDVPRMVKFVQSLQQDLEQEKIKESASITTTTTTAIKQQSGNMGAAHKSYGPFVEYVRKGQACGPDDCEGILGRNVANEKTSAFGKHSVDDTSNWGQPTSESQALRAGLTTDVLQRTWQIEA